MKIELEATSRVENVNGVPARIWRGKTASGIEITAWINCIQVRADADNEQFERELREVKVERELISFDLRLVT
jgi:hypothetical protein